MNQAPSASRFAADGARTGPINTGGGPCYAALDLGTNNCRLLIATPARGGFRIVEAFSRIVRLGEGLSASGELCTEALDRAIAALAICAEKVRRRKVVRIRAVATQACRSASNGPAFIRRVEAETGLKLSIIPPEEEARLAVAGCANLLDNAADAALVIDVGGGSTELSWVSLRPPGGEGRRIDLKAWFSMPVGVVTMAERFPEPLEGKAAWYRTMVEAAKSDIGAFKGAEELRPVFEAGRAHLVGTSGAITSLAGMYLELPRYDRAQVDGLWMSEPDCRVATQRLIELGPEGRAAQPCIGKDRADLVLAGAAILQAVQELWPCGRVRVADRGLREGMLNSLMRSRKRRRRRNRAAGDTQDDEL
jgi:exopolyphosphatase/guanosine-5'-triphosphate,3'-diphosphate pyrophosphatase